MKLTTVLFLLVSFSVTGLAQGPQSDRQQFIRVDGPMIALTHVRVIDGTGAAPREDQTIVISDGKIQRAGPFDQGKHQKYVSSSSTTGDASRVATSFSVLS